MRSLRRSAWLAATYVVLTFPIAALWHLVLFPDAYAAPALRSQPLFALGILSTVLQAAVVGYLYPLLGRGGSPIREGVRFGVILGTFIGSYGVLAEAGKFEVGPVTGWLVHEGLFFALQWLVIGIAIALVDARLKRGSSSAAAL